MKKRYIIVAVIFSFGCNGIHGWFPGYTDPQPAPAQGCNKDLTVHYKYNCEKSLIMYFIEVNPGTTVECEKLNDNGTISANETKAVTVHKGK